MARSSRRTAHTEPLIVFSHTWRAWIHFNEPYKHAQHYLGSTAYLESRLQLHKNGNGARLMEVVTDAGISWQVSRLWPCETPEEARLLERRLKHWHGSNQFCPVCQGKPLDVYTSLRQGYYPFALHDKQGKHQPMGAINRPLFVQIERSAESCH